MMWANSLHQRIAALLSDSNFLDQRIPSLVRYLLAGDTATHLPYLLDGGSLRDALDNGQTYDIR